MSEQSAGIHVQDLMAALKKTSLAVFAWARPNCVLCAKREASRKIPLGRKTRASTPLEAENTNAK